MRQFKCFIYDVCVCVCVCVCVFVYDPILCVSVATMSLYTILSRLFPINHIINQTAQSNRYVTLFCSMNTSLRKRRLPKEFNVLTKDLILLVVVCKQIRYTQMAFRFLVSLINSIYLITFCAAVQCSLIVL